MDRRDILVDNPVEKRRGYMPGVSVSPGRILFTAGMTGRQPDGTIVSGGMAAQTQRTMERLQAILQHAGANFSQVIKQLLYIRDGVKITPRFAFIVGVPSSSTLAGAFQRRSACSS